ncbi:MAG: OmpA family protein [Paludibacteraceae bacterium]
MRKFFSVLLCVLLSVASLSAANNKSKKPTHKKISKTYANAPLKDVIEDIGKRADYTIDYAEAELDLLQPVNVKLKDVSATAALKKILGKKFVVKAKKSLITITRVPEPPVVYQSVAVLPSQVEEDEERIVRTYEDTTFSVKCRTVTQRIEPEPVEPPAPTSKGHYVQALLGVGYGSMGYSLTGDRSNGLLPEGKIGKNKGDLQGLLQVQYAYYFHENWGVNVGVGFSGYGSHAVLNTTARWNEQGDSDGELYNHLTEARDWHEQQITHIVELPIGVQCMYPLNEDNLRLQAGIGLRVGVPVYNEWALKSGAIDHVGEYPQWGMTIRDQQDRDFYTEQIGSEWSQDRQPLNLKSIALAVDANIGLAVPINKQLDLLCGLYFQMNCLDLNRYEQHDLGWQQPEAEQEYRKHTFMDTYDGLIASNTVNHVLPWGVGLRVGIQWHHIEKPKAPEPTFERLQVCDTTITLTARHDTIIKPKQEAAKEIVRLMHKSVIWFDVNSTEPKLEPADVLVQIASVLKENPAQHIIVSGHASKEGNARRNRILSEKRAQAVADLLIAEGVPADQISVEAHSSDIEYTVAEGQTHTIALDRRVEIIPIEE